VLGKANLDKMLEELDVVLPEEEATDSVTVNGWAMDTLGKIAEEGDSFESLGLVVKVLKMEGRRIEKLHVLVCKTGECEVCSSIEE
jgi:putative hemolysin